MAPMCAFTKTVSATIVRRLDCISRLAHEANCLETSVAYRPLEKEDTQLAATLSEAECNAAGMDSMEVFVRTEE
jgi:hypothetical protein